MSLLVKGFLTTGMQEKSNRYSSILLGRHQKFTLPYKGLENCLHKRPRKIHIANTLWLEAASTTLNLETKLRLCHRKK